MDLLKDLQQKAQIKSNNKTDKDITELFYYSKEWRKVRTQVLKRDKRECQV
jgi:5-methylcytosine-specific restriction endonuclease McrA